VRASERAEQTDGWRRATPSVVRHESRSRPDAVLALQRSAGNRAVVSMLQVQRWADQARGATGINVRMIQRFLNRAGARPELADDGIYGPRTQKAVREFQRMIYVRPTGVVDARTWASLKAGGQSSPRSPAALLGRAILISALAHLAAGLTRGARSLAQAPDAAHAQVVLRSVLGKARRAYPGVAAGLAVDPAFTVRQRRGAELVREIVLLSELFPASAPMTDPRALAAALERASEYAVLLTVLLHAQSPEHFVRTAPGVVRALGLLVVGLSRHVDGLAAGPPATTPAPVGAAGP
jgi:hypothetical protein